MANAPIGLPWLALFAADPNITGGSEILMGFVVLAGRNSRLLVAIATS